MRLQRLTHYLLTHRLVAVILTFLISYIPIFGMVSILIAGLFTLCVGISEGAILTLAATLIYFLAAASGTQGNIAPMVFWGAIIIAVLGNVLTWVFAAMLRRQCSWSFIVQVAALLGVLAISVIHLAYPNVADWWANQIQLFYTQATQLAGGNTGDKLSTLADTQLESVNTVKYFATGMVTSLVLLTALIQVMVARWWQLTVLNTGQIGSELKTIHLTRLAGILFILSLFFFYLENSVVLDILPVLCLLFSVAGLSVVHYLLGLMEPAKSRFWISMIYIVLMYSLTMIAMLPLFSVVGLMLPVDIAVILLMASVFVFIALGLFDVWFDLRKRIRKG